MLTRESFVKINEGSTFTHIKILEGDVPLAGSLIFFEEQRHYTRVVCSDVDALDVESPLQRIPIKGDSFDCGVTVIMQYDKDSGRAV